MAAPSLPARLRPKANAFLVLLDRWNRVHALTALPPGERFEELILDSAALLPFLDGLPAGARIVDLGSGMGIPALVLALYRPDLDVVALDASRKKTSFVKQAALELGLGNLSAVHGRAESLAPLDGHLGVSKATGSLPLLTGWWARHGHAGSALLALKTTDEPCPEGWSLRKHPYELPKRGWRAVIELRRSASAVPSEGTP